MKGGVIKNSASEYLIFRLGGGWGGGGVLEDFFLITWAALGRL